MNSQEVIVTVSLHGKNHRVGRLWPHNHRGKQSASFEYEENWLNHPERFALEPALPLTVGSFHSKKGTSLFGAMSDSAPDRWGRTLMRRSQSATNHTGTLLESDYLLGVNDEARQGALRFSLPTAKEDFLAKKNKNTIPPLIELGKLLSATERFMAKNENLADLKLLLAPGSSLGGARPKTSVRDQNGDLMIAKFPRQDDELNVVTWEAVALTLAKHAGISTPSFRLTHVLQKPVLLIKRFDRLGTQRIPFLSAMSMLDAQDNEPHSYLEIAYALIQYGSAPQQDLHELWRRIIFSIMISNTDDHLRNHGFLYEHNKGWRLSPIYDVNPTPIEIKPHVLTTAIDFDNTHASLETALCVAKEFRLTTPQAKRIIQEVNSSVQKWRQVARQFGLKKVEHDSMASAFQAFAT